MYGWVGLRDWGQGLIKKCQKDWPVILGLEIRKDGSICMLRLKRGEQWLLTDAVLLPAETAGLDEQAERISARLAREGWEDIPRVLLADKEQVVVPPVLPFPPKMEAEERREAAYWELESLLSREGLAIEDFQVVRMDLEAQQAVWSAAVNREYITQVQSAFAKAEIPLVQLVVGEPLTSQVEFDLSDGGWLRVGERKISYAQSAAGLSVQDLEGALVAAVLFCQGIEMPSKRELWLLDAGDAVSRWNYQRLVMVMLAVVAALSCLLVGWDGWRLYQSQQRVVKCQQELEALQPAWQKMNAMEQLHGRIDRKEQCLQRLSQARFPWYSLLVHFGTMTVDGVWLDGIGLREQDVIQIDGQAVSYDAIADFVQAFEKDKEFFPAGPVLETSASESGKEQRAAAGTVRFRMTLHL